MSHNVSRAAVLSRIATVEGGEVVTQMVREVVENVQFRADMQDSKLRTHLTLSPDAPIDGTLQLLDPMNVSAGATPVSTSRVASCRMFHRVEELLKNPAQGSNSPDIGLESEVTAAAYTIGHLGSASIRLRASDPLQELHLRLLTTGKMLYGRIPLSRNSR